jgi:TolB protein
MMERITEESPRLTARNAGGLYLTGGLALSPDGKRMATVIFAGGQGVADIWIFDLTRQTSTRLTFGPGSQSNPVWSPDGMTIFYESNMNGPPHIYAKAADGSGSERLILDEGSYP